MTYRNHEKNSAALKRRVETLQRKEKRLLKSITRIERGIMKPEIREKIIAELTPHMKRNQAEHLCDWLCLVYVDNVPPKAAAAKVRKDRGLPQEDDLHRASNERIAQYVNHTELGKMIQDEGTDDAGA